MYVNSIINKFIESLPNYLDNIANIINSISTVSIFYIINTLIVLTIVFIESQRASTSWAWILVLLLIPYLGLILYLLLGRTIYREKIFPYSRQEKIEYQQRMLNRKKPYEISVEDTILYKNKNLISLNFKSDQAFLTTNNDITVITDGNEKFKLLFEDIKNAKEYIHIQYYIIKMDNIGKKLFDLLEQKLNEGVKIYILYDDIGSRTLNRITLRRLRNAGAKTKSFFKSSLPLINLRMNYRNHRKIVVIDGKIGYTGGFNVGDEYIGLDKNLGYWRDTHIRIVGDAVSALNFRFIDDWNSQVQQRGDSDFISLLDDHICNHENMKQTIPIQIVTSGPDKRLEQIKLGYLNMINRAKEYIYIQSPYFIPDESVMDALKMAILSGIDVRIMIPNKPDHIFVRWANYAYVGELVKLGARVYEYNKGFLHAKTIIVDDSVTSVGSANFDNRSFKLNFEINSFIYDNATTIKFKNIFLEDTKSSKLLSLDKYLKRSIIIKIKESISKLISPIL